MDSTSSGDLTWVGVDPRFEVPETSPAGHELLPGWAHELPFPDDSFDLVLLANVYEHVDPDLRNASLAEIQRVLAPGGTPRGIIDRLHADITKALAQPEVVQTLSASGIEPAGANSPGEFTAYLRAEIIKWAKVVKASGARAD